MTGFFGFSPKWIFLVVGVGLVAGPVGAGITCIVGAAISFIEDWR